MDFGIGLICVAARQVGRSRVPPRPLARAPANAVSISRAR